MAPQGKGVHKLSEEPEENDGKLGGGGHFITFERATGTLPPE